MVKGVKNIFLGGEGLFLATLKGPRKVYLQTLPLSRMADTIVQAGSTCTVEQVEAVGIAGIVSYIIKQFFK